jgi:MscS family membrane protein
MLAAVSRREYRLRVNIAEHVPQWMLTEGPGGLAVWQWLGLAVAIFLAWLVGYVVMWLVARAVAAMTRRTSTTFDDELLDRLRGPVRALAIVGLVRAQIRLLDFGPSAYGVAMSVLLASFAVVLVWAALRAIDVATSRMTAAEWAVRRPASRALLSLVGRIAKVIVIVIAGIGFLGGIGLPVASLLAGLGIGGIALAFGAQKTVENLFGAVAIGVDQPLREGDFVKVEADVMGTVETVGLRSTRIRTLERTVVTLPNGKLADMKVETFAPRDRCRLQTVLNIVYGTTADQLREILAGLERVLREHPGVIPEEIVVRFAQLGASSLDIDVIAMFKTSDWNQFRTWRQEVLIGFMDVVEKAKSSFAFPTRTVHVVGGGAGPTARPS